MTTTAIALEEEFQFLPLGRDVQPLGALTPPYPTEHVIAEIKPHTQRGISDGIKQLRGRLTKGATRGSTKKLMLITYRPVGRQLLVLVGNPPEVRRAIDNPSTPFNPMNWKWYTLGHVKFDVNQSIPAAQCPAYVGKMAEPLIRRHYWQSLGLANFGSKKVSGTGPDIDHEFAARLAEFEVNERAQFTRILEQMRKELELRFNGPRDPRLVQRFHRLRVLFGSIPGSESRALYGRLGDQRTRDPLSQLFHGRLATATRRELLRILRSRFPAMTSTTPSPQVPSPLPAPTWPKRPLPAQARSRYLAAADALLKKVVVSGDPRTRRYLCILGKLAAGADDRVIEWHNICPSTSGAIGAALVIGPCDLTRGSSVNQAALEAAGIRSIGDVESGNRQLEFMTYLRSDILFTDDMTSPSVHLENLRGMHDDVRRTLGNLEKWANAPMGGSSAMPQAYRSIAGWIQLQRDNPNSVLSCF